jgi:hypothetical protein
MAAWNDLQSGFSLHQLQLETHYGAGAVRQTNNGFKSFSDCFRPLSPREPRSNDPQGAKLQPFVLGMLQG